MKIEATWISALAFIIAGLSTIPAIIHMSFFTDTQMLDHFDAWPWLFGGLLYIVGAVIYAMKWPECVNKHGKYDFIGNSHNIFHILIVLAALVHWYGSIRVFHER